MIPEKVDLIIEALQAIQAIRSTGAAHRKGEKFEKSLEKYGLNGLSNEGKVQKLVLSLYKGLQSIIEHLHDKNSHLG